METMLMTKVRERLGPIALGIVVTFLAVGFALEGIVLKGGSLTGVGAGFAGSVNGEPISLSEFNREVERRMEMFRNILGSQVTEEQLKMFRVRESVFQELAQRKVVVQGAKDMGLIPSDQEVRDQVLEIPALKKEGRFDKVHYQQVLQANRWTPAQFEALIANDLANQSMRHHFESLAQVAEREIEQAYLEKETKRNVSYVFLSVDQAQAGLKVEDAAVDAYLAVKEKENLAKARFEAEKEKKFKGKTFEQVKREVATELLTKDRAEEARKSNEQFAEELFQAWKSTGRAATAPVAALLKGRKASLQSIGNVSSAGLQIPGFSDTVALKKALFGAGKTELGPQKLQSAAGVLIVQGGSIQVPDVSRLGSSQRARLRLELVEARGEAYFRDWLNGAMKRAKIDQNKAIISGSGDENA